MHFGLPEVNFQGAVDRVFWLFSPNVRSSQTPSGMHHPPAAPAPCLHLFSAFSSF